MSLRAISVRSISSTGRIVAAVAMAAMVLSPVMSEARPGGSKSGSRGSQTNTAPPSTSTAPGAAQPMQRSMTPNTGTPNTGAPATAARPGVPAAGAAAAAQAAKPSFARTMMMGLGAGLLGAGLFGLLSGSSLFGGLGGPSAPFIDVPGGVTFNGIAGQRASTEISVPGAMDGQAIWMNVPSGNGSFKVALPELPSDASFCHGSARAPAARTDRG